MCEKRVEPFLRRNCCELERIFDDERFPNVVCGTDGTVIATWGRNELLSRSSYDGGSTWNAGVRATEGIHGGGTLVDESTGDVFAFTHPEHPSGDHSFDRRTTVKSEDNGQTWEVASAQFAKDSNGNVPALHMCERGLTLQHSSNAGRLIRPARVYGDPGYNTAIYSDDGGETWEASEPFPIEGTGEAAIEELRDGRLYYSSRKHYFDPEAEELRHERLVAWSDDGGETWTNPTYESILPDGPRYRGEEGRGSNYNGHFGMMGGLTRLPSRERDILLYSNADNPGHERKRMTVWASFDGAQTWPVKRLVDDEFAAYSSLVAGRPETPSEGWVYLLYESGSDGDYEDGTLARFDLGWLLDGTLTGDGDIPAELSN